ncbi:CBS domain-containing protein [Capillimicrobium parvum]|uniref:CBS domain-containing protein n=1 Tax=Capillimicrobium parvum TaxID=2884022 RepID=A0A9E6XTX3_9ACTN|nr:CBS domain-containing protein [Capillimicrobium parvum]UGS34415.1 hypothetical protein DSM104329_00793 [Capillimicrobium parvum]
MPDRAPTALTNLTVGFAMHPGVLSAPAGAGLRTVAAVMAAHQVHGVMVDGDGRPRMTSDLDVLAAAVSGGPGSRANAGGNPVPILTPETPLATAARALVDAEATHALVQGPSDDAPRGVLSAFDVVAMIGGIDPRSAGRPRPHPARPALSERRLERARARDVAHLGMIAVSPATSVHDLAAILARHRIHCATVMGRPPAAAGGHLGWSVASDLDVLGAVVGGQGDARARDIAATEPLTVDSNDPLDVVAGRLVEHATSHAVVTDAEGWPMGIVSTLDVIGVLAIGA